MCRRILGRLPRILKSSGIVVSNHVLFMTFGRVPPAAFRCAIRKMPRQKERILCFAAGRNFALETKRAYAISLFRFGTKFAIGREVIPKE